MAANLIKGGQAATIAGSLITGAAIAEGAVMLKLAENVADAGHAQEELALKFGMSAEQAGKWNAAADAVGVGSDSMGVAFKTLAKNMEGLKLLDNTARLKELNKEMLAGTTLDAKAAAEMDVLQHKAGDLATQHVILTAQLQNAIVKHGAHSLEVLKATKALNDNTFAIGQNEDKITGLMATEGKATTIAAQHAKAVLDAAAAARPMQVVFNELGVAVNDSTGKLRPINDVMFDIANKLAAMPDGAEKAGMAIKLFGRSGTDLLPLLDQGQAGIQKFMDQAVLSGKVLDDSQVKEAQAAYLAHKQLDQAISGVTTQLSLAFLPALTTFLQLLTPMLHNIADWIKHHEKLLSVLIPLAIIITGLIGVLLTVGGVIMMVAGVVMSLGVVLPLAGTALAAVGAVALPLIIIIAAIVAVALALWFAITHWTQIKQIAGEVWQAIGDMVGKIGTFFGQLGANVEHAWSEFWKRPFYYIGLLAGFVLESVIKIHDNIVQWYQKMVETAAKWIQNLPDNARTAFITLLGNIAAWAGQAIPAMQKGAKDMGDQLIKELKKLPGQVISIGADIAKGIVKGLLSVPGTVAKGTQDFIGGFVQGAKNAAHIKSPSALFASEVGMPIAQGIAAGIKAGLPEATGALDALVANAGHGINHHPKASAHPKHKSAGAGNAAKATGTTVEELLQKILDAILNNSGIASAPGGSGKGALSPYDILAAFNHMVEAAQIQRNRGTRAGYVT